jgi:glyoxalase family protein
VAIFSLHHVTATVDEAQADLDFCLGALGLRLVKRTVNFDNHHVYHFYYGDERGTPGTIWTTFPYAGRGVPAGTKGAGQVITTSFSVPTGSLAFWRTWLAQRSIAVTDVEPRFGGPAVAFSDPSGLMFELIANGRDERRPWTGSAVDADMAVRGLHSVTCAVRDPEGTLELFTGLLGFSTVDRTKERIRLSVGEGGPGRTLDLAIDEKAPAASNGLGTVHHVALAIDTEDAQLALREDLLHRGARVTEVRDRCYFKSIYFREPGGVLIEVATVQPGFTADEDVSHLGRDLKLPSWEEANRADIEAALTPVSASTSNR